MEQLTALAAHNIAKQISKIDELLIEIKRTAEIGLTHCILRDVPEVDIELLKKLGYKIVRHHNTLEIDW